MDSQALDDSVVQDVLGENFFHVFFGFRGIPDVIRIDDYRRTLCAGVEAPGFVDPYLALESTVVDALLQIV